MNYGLVQVVSEGMTYGYAYVKQKADEVFVAKAGVIVLFPDNLAEGPDPRVQYILLEVFPDKDIVSAHCITRACDEGLGDFGTLGHGQGYMGLLDTTDTCWWNWT